MDIKELKTEFITLDVLEHLKHKAILLDLINKIPSNSYEQVSKTDWNLPKKLERKYLEYFYSNIVNNIMDQQQKYFKAKSWKISNGWFQQYEKNSFHVYHNHPNSNFTNVYFLELPNKDHVTEIKDVEYDAEEGYLITFPATMLHRCKVVSGGRKTIISFNSSLL